LNTECVKAILEFAQEYVKPVERNAPLSSAFGPMSFSPPSFSYAWPVPFMAPSQVVHVHNGPSSSTVAPQSDEERRRRSKSFSLGELAAVTAIAGASLAVVYQVARSFSSKKWETLAAQASKSRELAYISDCGNAESSAVVVIANWVEAYCSVQIEYQRNLRLNQFGALAGLALVGANVLMDGSWTRSWAGFGAMACFGGSALSYVIQLATTEFPEPSSSVKSAVKKLTTPEVLINLI